MNGRMVREKKGREFGARAEIEKGEIIRIEIHMLRRSLVNQTTPFPVLVMQYIQRWGREWSGSRD